MSIVSWFCPGSQYAYNKNILIWNSWRLKNYPSLDQSWRAWLLRMFILLIRHCAFGMYKMKFSCYNQVKCRYSSPIRFKLLKVAARNSPVIGLRNVVLVTACLTRTLHPRNALVRVVWVSKLLMAPVVKSVKSRHQQITMSASLSSVMHNLVNRG